MSSRSRARASPAPLGGGTSSQRAGAPTASTSKGKSTSRSKNKASFDDDDDDDDDEDDDGAHVVASSSFSGTPRRVNGNGQQNGDAEAHDLPATGRNGSQAAGNDDGDLSGMPAPTASSIAPGEEREEDCIKILLATDNHIGYGERDPIRGRDSLITFEEILKLAVENEVDMLLLAGDLFHENKPSRGSLHQTIALMREYCMGDRPIALQVVSDVGVGLQSGYSFPPINYEDVNYNISLPIFSIHGNHDDPQGAGPEGALCALDMLSACGLVNYFGRQELPGDASTDEQARESGIQVKPILLCKGETKLAMYGVGNIRDERFHAEMRKNRISMFRPAEDMDKWFNLLLIHQNRVPRGPKSSVPENGFGDEIDLIVWGHEHDCRIDPEPVTGKGYYISQPGSSVATSLAAGEAIPKHVGLLKIQNKAFDLTKIRLKTVRPFVMDDLILADVEEIEDIKLETKVQVNKYLKKRVTELIEKANAEWDELNADEDGNPDPNAPPRPLPLVRLRVEYTNQEIGNPQRFGQDFTNKVANPRDIVQFTRKKKVARGKKITIDQPEGLDPAAFGEADELPERIEKIKVETLVRQYLEAQTLQLLHENGIGSAVNAFVEKDDKHAIDTFITKTLDTQRKEIERTDRTEEAADTDEEIEQNMHVTKTKLAEQFEEKNAKKGKGKARQEESEQEDEEDGGSDFDKMSVDSAPAAKKGAAKGKAAPKGTGGGNKKKGSTLFNEESDDENEEEASDDPPPPKKKTAASTSKKAATTTKAKKAAAPTQSQLAFAPSRGSTGTRAAAKTATSKNKKSARADSDEDEDASVNNVDDSEDEPPKKKAPARKR